MFTHGAIYFTLNNFLSLTIFEIVIAKMLSFFKNFIKRNKRNFKTNNFTSNITIKH